MKVLDFNSWPREVGKEGKGERLGEMDGLSTGRRAGVIAERALILTLTVHFCLANEPLTSAGKRTLKIRICRAEIWVVNCDVSVVTDESAYNGQF